MKPISIVAFAASWLLGGCSLEPPSGVMVCESEKDCPPGWICDGFCYRESDNGHATDTQDTSGVPSPCETARQLDSKIVCCPAALPETCDYQDWSFSPVQDTASVYGCCSRDMNIAVSCLGTGEWAPRTCESPCRFDAARLTCDGPSNNRCSNPIVISDLPASWYGHWSNFGNTEVPTNDCGSGGDDALFLVSLSASGTLIVRSPDPANLRHVVSCADLRCLSWTYSPNSPLEIQGEPGAQAVIMVSATSTRDRAFALHFAP